MTDVTDKLLMLAQAQTQSPNPGQAYFDDISKNFSSDGLISTHWLLISAGAVLLLLSCLSIFKWWKHRDQHSHPLLVYLGTAKLAGIGMGDRLILWHIARRQALGSPLTLMLSPTTFDHHVKAYLSACPGWRRQRVQRRTQAIRETLFGDLPAQWQTGAHV